jgi:hypothetical protein
VLRNCFIDQCIWCNEEESVQTMVGKQVRPRLRLRVSVACEGRASVFGITPTPPLFTWSRPRDATATRTSKLLSPDGLWMTYPCLLPVAGITLSPWVLRLLLSCLFLSSPLVLLRGGKKKKHCSHQRGTSRPGLLGTAMQMLVVNRSWIEDTTSSPTSPVSSLVVVFGRRSSQHSLAMHTLTEQSGLFEIGPDVHAPTSAITRRIGEALARAMRCNLASDCL